MTSRKSRVLAMIRWLVTFCFAVTLCSANADELHGRVVGVSDGDTITVLDAKKHQHRVRLAGIDAPEKGQPFADRSRQQLVKWIHGQDVLVDWHKRDRYGRLVGVVIAFGHDVGLEQIRAGLAWWYREYAKEQNANDRQLYELAEDDARQAKRGLWTEPQPVPPWEWRRTQRRPATAT
jgi:endonuclease YncB( thermonuclease family)